MVMHLVFKQFTSRQFCFIQDSNVLYELPDMYPVQSIIVSIDLKVYEYNYIKIYLIYIKTDLDL